MNNEGDRERSGDGAGPVANDDSAGPFTYYLLTVMLLLLPSGVFAGKADTLSLLPSPATTMPGIAQEQLQSSCGDSFSSSFSLQRNAFSGQREHPLWCLSPAATPRFFSDTAFTLKSSPDMCSRSAVAATQSRRTVVARRRSNDNYQTGLSLTLGAGVMFSGNGTANFYNGSEGNVNTIYRILHSERYGYPIWQALTEQNLISDAVSNYSQLTVAEYGDMDYNLGVQLQFGFRYDLAEGWGWLIKFDYCKLTARGAFLIDATNGTGILTNTNRYITCPIVGEEKRIFIDMGISKRFRMNNGLDLGVEGGLNINNVKVVSNDIQVAGTVYSILDVWNGNMPSDYTQDYEYINQGGLGLGGFATADVSYTLPNLTSLTLGYTCYDTKINLQGYEQYTFQHLIFLRVDVNNFDFLGSR